MLFEWDPNKNDLNIEKHGIDFNDAQNIFEGFTLEHEDSRRDYGKSRIAAMGEINGFVLIVVYTWRGHTRRLISARLAKQEERARYYEQIQN